VKRETEFSRGSLRQRRTRTASLTRPPKQATWAHTLPATGNEIDDVTGNVTGNVTGSVIGSVIGNTWLGLGESEAAGLAGEDDEADEAEEEEHGEEDEEVRPPERRERE
jgi:hypothetical protein